MVVEAKLTEDSTSTRAILQSVEACYFGTYINFTVTKGTGESYLTCDGVSSVASANVTVTQFNTHLKGKSPPHQVHISWSGYGTEMGSVTVGA